MKHTLPRLAVLFTIPLALNSLPAKSNAPETVRQTSVVAGQELEQRRDAIHNLHEAASCLAWYMQCHPNAQKLKGHIATLHEAIEHLHTMLESESPLTRDDARTCSSYIAYLDQFVPSEDRDTCNFMDVAATLPQADHDQFSSELIKAVNSVSNAIAYHYAVNWYAKPLHYLSSYYNTVKPYLEREDVQRYTKLTLIGFGLYVYYLSQTPTNQVSGFNRFVKSLIPFGVDKKVPQVQINCHDLPPTTDIHENTRPQNELQASLRNTEQKIKAAGGEPSYVAKNVKWDIFDKLGIKLSAGTFASIALAKYLPDPVALLSETCSDIKNKIASWHEKRLKETEQQREDAEKSNDQPE